MNTQHADPTNPQENFELRIRTLRFLWFGLFMSTVLYYGLTLLVGPREGATPNQPLSVILACIALFTTLISFLIKSRLMARAVEQQQVSLVQQGYTLVWALCEASALLGLLDFFMTGNRFYYIPFVISALGLLLQFPRREHVVNASSRTPIL